MGLIYEPNSLIERRMEYERKRWEEERRGDAAWQRERLRRLRGETRDEEEEASEA